MAAQRSPTPLSQGSSPWGYANFVGAWCNGNTTGFELVILGSIPSVPANTRDNYKFKAQHV